MKIIFTIKGNHEDPHGNPLPKLRMTRRQSWKPEAQRYAGWKRYVQLQFLGAVREQTGPDEWNAGKRRLACGKKPIALPAGATAEMSIHIRWKNGAHADPENVFGSIADALFENDKYLAGSFGFDHSENGIGRTEVHIAISKTHQK